MQTPALPTEKEPSAQSVHAAAPATEYFPAAHGTHFVMPVLAANVPAAQFCVSCHGEKNNQYPSNTTNIAISTKKGTRVAWGKHHSYLASARSLGAHIVVVRPSWTRRTSGTRCGPSVGVVRACRALRACGDRRGSSPIIVGAGWARQARRIGGGADAGAVGARRTCCASGEGGRRRVRVVGTRRTHRARTRSCDGVRSDRTRAASRRTCCSSCSRILSSGT